MSRFDKYFLKAAELKSISLAASFFNKNQSTISRSILFLEEKMRTKLVVHNSKPLQLTQEGLVYYVYQELIEHLEHKRLDSLAKTDYGHISVGYTYPVNWSVVSKVIDSHLKKHPGTNVKCICCSRNELSLKLFDGSLDFAISPIELYVDGLDTIATVVNIEWGLIVPEGMPQAKRQSVTTSDLKYLPIIMNDNPYFYHLLESHLKLDLSRTHLTYDNTSTLLGMIKDGYGVGFITSNEKNMFESQGLKFIPLNPKLEAKFYVYSRNYSTLHLFAKNLHKSISNKVIDYKDELYQTEVR